MASLPRKAAEVVYRLQGKQAHGMEEFLMGKKVQRFPSGGRFGREDSLGEGLVGLL